VTEETRSFPEDFVLKRHPENLGTVDGVILAPPFVARLEKRGLL